MCEGEVAGHWKMMKVLGRGGFGKVTLWQNPSTGQEIAIKKLLDSALKDTTLKTKLIERWCNEVEIMKKLNHGNIVATLEIPAELTIVDPLPVLAMEYCTKGDLRQVLTKAHNCCGLQEPDVLNILRDISSGLAYLHSCKIIHRDIKPDNVVLQEKGSDVIYKLIDLGYAKTLDQSSLSKSFVGTAQYIAPELFMGKAYSSSVDYWSFGLMAHEIITGYRPFLPGFDPSDWMKQIQNKSRQIVSVLENASGEIVTSTKISQKNHMSRCFLEDIEKWLCLALDWDGQTRGRDLQKNRLVIFENLSKIICKKIIKIFSLPTYEILSYEITSQTDTSDLRELIKVDTGLDKDDQHLLFPNGKCLNKKGNLLKNLEIEKPNESGLSFFLCNSRSMGFRKNAIRIPDFVVELMESSNNFVSYRQLKRLCADSIYFAQSEANLYRYLLQGIKVKITNTKQKTLAVESLYEDLEEEWNRIEHYGHFLSLSLKIDLESYICYRKNGQLKSSSFARKWIHNAVDVNNKITELKNTFNKSKQRQLMLLAKQICRNLDDHSHKDASHRTPFDCLVEMGHTLWENLKNSSKTDKTLLPTTSLSDLINNAVEERSKFLNSQILQTLFMKISEADDNLAKFLSQLTNVYKSTNALKRLIENTQIERQKEVWSLIGSNILEETKLLKKRKSFENSEANDLFAERNDTDQFSAITHTTRPCCNWENISIKESKINQESMPDFVTLSLYSSDLVSGSFFPSERESHSVIEDNNHLRYRIQEIQQSCNRMLKEINSLTWDFIYESESFAKL